jgi:hypothetical protein
VHRQRRGYESEEPHGCGTGSVDTATVV